MKPFELDNEVHFIGLEFDDGHQEFLPYLSLREFQFREMDIKDHLECIELHFDQGIGTIQGMNLRMLVPSIARELVSVLRKGIHEDPEQPAISEIRFERHEREEEEESHQLS